MDLSQVNKTYVKCKAPDPQKQIKEILDEAERSFDRAIIDFNTGVEKLFDVLNMLADNHVVTNEHEKE